MKHSATPYLVLGSNGDVVMARLHAGCRVRGKTIRLRGKVGVVEVVRSEFRQIKYDVWWPNREVETMAGRAIELDGDHSIGLPPDEQPVIMNDPACSTFTELLRSSNAVYVGELDASSSDGNSEAEVDGISDEEDDDADVIANGRRWRPCSSILLDQGSPVHSRSTQFSIGVIGGRSF